MKVQFGFKRGRGVDGVWPRTLGAGGAGFFQGESGGLSAGIGHSEGDQSAESVSRGPGKRCVRTCGVTLSQLGSW